MGLWGPGTDIKVLLRMEERWKKQQVSHQSLSVRDESVVTAAPLYSVGTFRPKAKRSVAQSSCTHSSLGAASVPSSPLLGWRV